MSRLLRATAAGIVGLAMVASLVGICPCGDFVGQANQSHDCCAPSAGLRAPIPDCCADARPAAPGVLAHPVAVAAPAAVALTTPSLALLPDGAASLGIAPVFSPTPPPILRI